VVPKHRRIGSVGNFGGRNPTRCVLSPVPSDFGVERSLGKEEAIAALKLLRPKTLDENALVTYFDERGRVIEELFGGRISFQVRKWMKRWKPFQKY